MHDGALRVLEFDRIVEIVRGFALTPLGATALSRLRPFTDARSVQTALAATTEGVKYLEANAPFALDGPQDLEQILAALAVERRPLEPSQLTGLADFLASVDAVRAAVTTATGGPFQALCTILEGSHSFEREVVEIRTKIDSQGAVVDHASPKLRTIRERLRKQRNRLRGMLESYLRGHETAKHLQEQIITTRGGRFVLVVRAEHRNAIPGVVHGSSGSGASLFLEPLSTVEINNNIVALEEDATHEVRRILLSLANMLRARALDLRHTLVAATDIDVIQARASFSRLVGGVEPALASDAWIELPRARHPLLIPAVRARVAASPTDRGLDEMGEPVPVDIRLTPPTSTLIVTGPNTGGKTVALKTTGLLVLMGQAGLHVPAGPGSRVAVFRSVFADIGDEQSIATSLSTFSGHITNIVAMDRDLALPALVLLDEVGAGTDPVEGGVLGAALIDHFRRRGAWIVATTHDDLLKSYASTTPGVICAGFGFNPATFVPTYQLTYGSPGHSLALEIAAKLGVSPAIIDAARARLSTREAQLAEHLSKIEHDLRMLDDDRADVAEQRERLAEDRARLADELLLLKQREGALDQRIKDSIEDQLRTARREIDTIVEGLRARASELAQDAATQAAGRQPALSTGEQGALRREGLAALNRVTRRFIPDPAADSEPSTSGSANAAAGTPVATVTTRPAVGTRVVVDTLGFEGEVVAVHDREAEVDVRGKRVRAKLDEVRVVAAHAAATGGGVTVDVERSSEPWQDLNVIGCTVDEALSRAEKYLDHAVVCEQRFVRVIHGHGTGQLRRALARFLGEHPLVTRFELAPREHGGGGVTVVELKEE